MKFSWGIGIIAVFGVFIFMILTMVGITITKDVDLVTPNYYEKEIKYQEEIDKINNTAGLKEQVIFELNGPSLIISFPLQAQNRVIKGDVSFYRPSDSKKDFNVQIETDKEFKQAIDVSKIDKGLWKVNVNWSMDGIDYLSNSIFVKE